MKTKMKCHLSGSVVFAYSGKEVHFGDNNLWPLYIYPELTVTNLLAQSTRVKVNINTVLPATSDSGVSASHFSSIPYPNNQIIRHSVVRLILC